jgi:hypothetical protein
MFNFNYYANAGIVDFFELAYDKYELIERLSRDYSEIVSTGKDDWLKELNDFEDDLVTIMELKENEKPYLIKYFGLPSFNDGHFRLCCLARISNNGITYLVAEDKETILFLSDGIADGKDIYEF